MLGRIHTVGCAGERAFGTNGPALALMALHRRNMQFLDTRLSKNGLLAWLRPPRWTIEIHRVLHQRRLSQRKDAGFCKSFD